MEWTCSKCETQVPAKWFDTEERMCHECLDQEYCDHDKKVYQPAEPDNNVPEDFTCEDCGKSFDIPEPDFDSMVKWR